MESEFYKTMRGKTFYDATMPQLVEALEKLAVELARANDLKERYLRIMEQPKTE